MAPIKIERIISVSSEDEVHSASNLLKTDYTNKKWKCKAPGEKQISLVFQLAQFCRIFSIDVGNEHSAFIEVLVGKSSTPNEDFKVLLVSSSLMTLQESKISSNINGVNFFKEESLCKPVSEDKWDRVKVVCTQPFNKHVQFGLSFIIFHSNDSQAVGSSSLTTNVNSILSTGGLFANRNKRSDRSSLTGAAAIRAAHGNVKINLKMQNTNEDDSTNLTYIPAPSNDGAGYANCRFHFVYGCYRDVSCSYVEMSDESDDSVLKCLEDSGSEFDPGSIESGSSAFSDDESPKFKVKKLPNGTSKGKAPENEEKRKNIKGGARDHSKNNYSPPKKKIALASVQAFKKRAERPFGNLMSGVVFAMSGFENPLRYELRNKALAMGARYEANWSPNCTHLICAFRNTPKYNQVRGRGKIVKSAWIVDCHSRRKRLPWRRFALDTNDAAQAESEEEIFEEVVASVAVDSNSGRNALLNDDDFDEDGDTDDEIERVRLRQNHLKANGTNSIDNPSTSERSCQPGPSGTSGMKTTTNGTIGNPSGAKDDVKHRINKEGSSGRNNIAVDDNKNQSPKKETVVYDMDTESEDENFWFKKNPEEDSLPPLPTFFKSATIALLDDLSVTDKKLLTRYIKAHKGSIADDSTDLNTILYAITEDSTAIERVREDFPQVIGVLPEWIWRSHDEAKLLPASSFEVK